MEMLQKDYGNIIVKALCNSHPDLYTDYFNRKFKELREQDYTNREIKFKIDSVIQLIKDQIKSSYDKQYKDYQNYKLLDKTLPIQNRYNYPKPDINNIPILQIKYPSGASDDLHGLTKKFYLPDIELIKLAVDELLGEVTTTPKIQPITKLTLLLKLYFERDCKPLRKQQVEQLASENGLTKTVMINRWVKLKADHYRHNGNVNNVKEFIIAYNYLLTHFIKSNPKAYRNVKNQYDQLSHTYPDLAY